MAFDARDFLTMVTAMTSLVLVFAGIGSAGLVVARWARAQGRRPWVWILLAYATPNLAIEIAQVVVRNGAR